MSQAACRAAVAVAVLLLAGSSAAAKPPPNPDPALSAWFQGLADPETTLSCCDEADCRPVDDRVTAAGYQVLLRGAWVAVPEGKILRGTRNPLGRAVLCWSPNFGIMCFVPGPGT